MQHAKAKKHIITSLCQIFFFNFLAPFILSHNTNMKDMKEINGDIIEIPM